MAEITELIARHGLALVFGNVLLEAIGLPIPAVPTLVIAGALASQGKLSAAAVFAFAVIACTIGDTLWYAAGRRYGGRTMRLLCSISLSPDSCVRQTEYRFSRWGGWTLVLAKFIPGMSTIAPPLAGAAGLGWAPFLLWNGLSICIWAGLAIGGGMLFSAQIDDLFAGLEGFGAAALEGALAILALYIGLKWWERQRFYRTLRLARIGVDELRKLMDSGEQPLIVDVRSHASRKVDPRSIPSAIAIDMEEVERRLDQLPAERDIIFYCNCPNEASAAQVAKKLISLGYTRVRPLSGGLDAWIAAGHGVDVIP